MSGAHERWYSSNRLQEVPRGAARSYTERRHSQTRSLTSTLRLEGRGLREGEDANAVEDHQNRVVSASKPFAMRSIATLDVKLENWEQISAM